MQWYSTCLPNTVVLYSSIDMDTVAIAACVLLGSQRWKTAQSEPLLKLLYHYSAINVEYPPPTLMWSHKLTQSEPAMLNRSLYALSLCSVTCHTSLFNSLDNSFHSVRTLGQNHSISIAGSVDDTIFTNIIHSRTWLCQHYHDFRRTAWNTVGLDHICSGPFTW